jgi:hypothetical protein
MGGVLEGTVAVDRGETQEMEGGVVSGEEDGKCVLGLLGEVVVKEEVEGVSHVTWYET